MQVIRVYVFDGPPEWFEKFLPKSLPVGTTERGPGRTVTVVEQRVDE